MTIPRNPPPPWGKDFTGLVICDGITSVGDYAFSSSASLETVKISDGVTRIGKRAFYNCTKLKSMSSSTGIDAPAEANIIAFVSRCYNVILGRGADSAGLNTWVDQLSSGTSTASEIILQFMGSEEFTNKKATNEQIVTILYNAMLNRNPDDGGKQNWLSQMENGANYVDIIAGFCSSAEFSNLCKTYGIEPGVVKKEEEEDPDKVRAFVKRCYKLMLNRDADEGGLETWTTQLKTGKMSASVIIYQFMSSEEFSNRKATNEQIVDILYQTMLNRGADEGGRQNWLNHMANGATYVDIIAGFCDSEEFHNVCAEYGIDPGYVDVEDSDKVRAFVTRCYRLILNRAPDAAGQATWTEQLKSNTRTAAEIIFQFMTSDEYLNRKMSDADTIEILYKTMLGRESDPSGKQTWLDNLAKGQTVVHIINGFCVSAEFKAICESYGITPGSVAEEELTVLSKAVQSRRDAPKSKKEQPEETAEPAEEAKSEENTVIILGEGVIGTSSQSVMDEDKAAEFVTRCYKAALNRNASESEVQGWVDQIVNGKKSPADIVKGFLFSEEFKNRNLGSEEIVKILYKVYMNRDADPDGLANWIARLDAGASLEDIVKEFANSDEFKRILKDMKK